MAHTHDHAYGSARFASGQEIARAGLFRKGGMPFGFYGGRELYHHNRAGLLVIGGAGSGKTTSFLLPLLLRPGRFVFLDPKGEITAVILDGLAQFGGEGWCINPRGLFGLPRHKVSILSHLKTGSPSLISDIRRLWESLHPNASGENNRFFDDLGRRWGAAITLGIIVERGSVSLRSIYEAVCMIRANFDGWLDRAAIMAEDGPADLEPVFGEMAAMNSGEARIYDSVMSGLTNAVSFMADAAYQETFVDDREADFTLDVLCANDRVSRHVSFIESPELIGTNAAPIRQLFSTTRTLKQRAPGSPSVEFIIDEAAALGRFNEVADLYSIGRGMGVTPVAAYQDRGQITRNLGPTGAQTLSANAAAELILGGGVRDLATAQDISRRLGNQTVAVDDHLTQERAKQAKRELTHAVLFKGLDPTEAAQQMQRLKYEVNHQSKMSRALMEPNEVLGLDAAKTLVMAGGYQLPPFLADKVPYYKRRSLAGLFFPNPYVTLDMHAIELPRRFRSSRRAIIEEPVPTRLAHLPQYRAGRPLRYVEGFKP